MAALTVLKEKYWQNPLGDMIGGLMAAIVALPLCLAFGVASGLGAAAGLYGAIACGIFAALFGGTPGQCSGPTGPMTVVAAAILSANSGRPDLIFAATVLGGVIQIAMGYAKAGQLIGYIPYPVISGFMTGIGAIIVCIEIGPLFGLPAAGNALAGLESLGSLFDRLNSSAMMISAVTLVLIYVLPHLSKKLPASLVALIASAILAHILNLDVPEIGEIPSNLPLPRLPGVSIDDMHLIIQNGLTLAVLGAIDSLLTSLVLDKVTRRRHDSDRELIGQGLGNMASGLIGGLPGAGATMRSMVNVKSGGTTALSGALHGLILLAVLVFFSNIASEIPLASLAAILLTVGLSIMDWRVLRALGKTPRADVFVMVTVLVLTIFVDLIIAVLVGVALASVLFVKQLTDARPSSISDLETLEELREVSEHIPESVRKSTYSYVLNGPLFFGEAKNLADTIDKLADAKYIILRFLNVPLIDQTGAFALEAAIEKWQYRGIRVLLVGIQPNIRKILEDIGGGVNEENCFERFENAIEAINLWETSSADDLSSGVH
jgi:SulP family sulfate permease